MVTSVSLPIGVITDARNFGWEDEAGLLSGRRFVQVSLIANPMSDLSTEAN